MQINNKSNYNSITQRVIINTYKIVNNPFNLLRITTL